MFLCLARHQEMSELVLGTFILRLTRQVSVFQREKNKPELYVKPDTSTESQGMLEFITRCEKGSLVES